MWISRLDAELGQQAGTGERQNSPVVVGQGAGEAAKHDEAVERDEVRQARAPNSSPATAKMKSECASGR